MTRSLLRAHRIDEWDPGAVTFVVYLRPAPADTSSPCLAYAVV